MGRGRKNVLQIEKMTDEGSSMNGLACVFHHGFCCNVMSSIQRADIFDRKVIGAKSVA